MTYEEVAVTAYRDIRHAVSLLAVPGFTKDNYRPVPCPGIDVIKLNAM